MTPPLPDLDALCECTDAPTPRDRAVYLLAALAVVGGIIAALIGMAA